MTMTNGTTQIILNGEPGADSTLGDRVRYCLDNLFGGQTHRMAQRLNASERNLRKLMANKLHDAPARLIVRALGRYANINPEWLETGQGAWTRTRAVPERPTVDPVPERLDAIEARLNAIEDALTGPEVDEWTARVRDLAGRLGDLEYRASAIEKAGVLPIVAPTKPRKPTEADLDPDEWITIDQWMKQDECPAPAILKGKDGRHNMGIRLSKGYAQIGGYSFGDDPDQRSHPSSYRVADLRLYTEWYRIALRAELDGGPAPGLPAWLAFWAERGLDAFRHVQPPADAVETTS